VTGQYRGDKTLNPTTDTLKACHHPDPVTREKGREAETRRRKIQEILENKLKTESKTEDILS